VTEYTPTVREISAAWVMYRRLFDVADVKAMEEAERFLAAYELDVIDEAVDRLECVPCSKGTGCDFEECSIPTLEAIAAVRGEGE